MAGDAARAESFSQDLNKRFPLDTQMQSLWLPAIQAQLALDRKNPAPALNTLQAASSIELGEILFVVNISCLYPTYVRGEAYLAAGQGNAAAESFRKSSTTADRLEVLDGSVAASGRGAGERSAIENFARRRGRCHPCSSARRL
jgi:hypothetical protein